MEIDEVIIKLDLFCNSEYKELKILEDDAKEILNAIKTEKEKLDKLEKICTENLKSGTKITNLDVLEIIGRNEK